MAKCSKCGKDVQAFAIIDATTGAGKCDPCVTGNKPPIVPIPAPIQAPPPAKKSESKPEPKPDPKVKTKSK